MILPDAAILCILLRIISSSVPHPLIGRAVPQLPVHGGGLELPPPSKGLTFKAVVLGLGSQNYSCQPSNSTSQPVQIGAVATLYDLSPLPSALFDSVTALAFALDHSAVAQVLPVVGRHFFDAMKIPTFEIDRIGILHAKKVANIAAPAGASTCPVASLETAAVDWLKLDDNGGSSELREVYRVRTVGGRAPATCAGRAPDLLLPYAAQYWFYG